MDHIVCINVIHYLEIRNISNISFSLYLSINLCILLSKISLMVYLCVRPILYRSLYLSLYICISKNSISFSISLCIKIHISFSIHQPLNFELLKDFSSFVYLTLYLYLCIIYQYSYSICRHKSHI